MLVRSSDEATVCPLIAVITSPFDRPAESAGVPWYTWQTSAPELTGGVLPPIPPPPLATQLSGLLASPAEMPRKPARPMCTVALACPDEIWLVIETAWAIGIAKPMVAPGWPSPNPLDALAAVFMPMTSPAELTSGPPESPSWIGA